MIQKTQAIVIHSIKYAESDLIVHCYTKDFGLKSYYLKGILNNKKTKLKKSYFLPLNLLEIVAFHNNKGQLNSIRELQILQPYRTLHTDIYKQSIVLFISEILNQTLKEELHDERLFDYLKVAFYQLDQAKKVSNFHLKFVVNLIKYLGFAPVFEEKAKVFDMVEGKFLNQPISTIFIENEELKWFKSVLLSENFDENEVIFNRNQRNELLDRLMQYMTLHINNFKKPKSMVVLKELFD
jgi:DNA repair protein RecO (recombination protein O)